ncbi:hypothetical protein BURMUCGD2M_2437 [Burkholderia multivorans CGD2M]|uniref:Uncharacterized protein n=1 Tax=Burkholderia multivorans CGD2 TaxID=513052 RepID=B9BNC2_9BURK|nr:hypothetical protein BURMUCGD2_2350 [Burkholderia multivorans CGD2]EEE10518.1 hypothetical protein BURMUCGD2M_2437 [Burkholderia multivorans CGD2M]
MLKLPDWKLLSRGARDLDHGSQPRARERLMINQIAFKTT